MAGPGEHDRDDAPAPDGPALDAAGDLAASGAAASEELAPVPPAHAAMTDEPAGVAPPHPTPLAPGEPAREPAPAPAPPPSPLRAAIGVLTGFVLIALTNAVAIAVTVPWPPGGARVRLAHHLFDLGQTLGLGVACAAVLALGARVLGRRLGIALTLYAAVASVVMELIVGQDLRRQAQVALGGRLAVPIYWALVALCGTALPVAHLLGAWLRRFRWLSLLPLVAALGGVITHHAILRDDYPGLHGAIAWTAATLAGVTLATRVEPWVRGLLAGTGAPRRVLAGRLALAAVVLGGVLGLAIPPPNRIRIQLFREPGAVGAWALAAAVWSIPELPVAAPPPASPWFASREGLPPVPPTTPRLVAGNPVVVMITIDATRGDVIADPKNDARYPVITGLKRSGAYFANATSPGSQTAVSLTTTFSGRYFSELFWSMHGEGVARFAYAADDTTPRFPEILAEHGVRTATFCSLNFLAGDFGVIRGFTEQRMIPDGRKHAFAKQVVDPVIERLRKVNNEPFFLYIHLMEPHAPYDRGADKSGSDKDRYLSEIAVADAEIGRITRLVQSRFKDRGIVVIGADHGEAFGEHGTFNHTKTLYQELLHVPLIIKGPGIVGRRIEQHVGLVDLGPTLLDLYGIDTPASFKGQSLLPLLAGRDVALERPLLAEGRLRRALYYDGLKLIVDDRRKLVEAYDLEGDPLELRSLFDDEPERVAPSLAALHAFFAANALRRPGYSPPFKP